jgi:hypothetical protein
MESQSGLIDRDLLSIGEHDRHGVRITAEKVRCHDEREVGGGHLGYALRLLVQEDLQEANDKQDHPSVDCRQPMHD